MRKTLIDRCHHFLGYVDVHAEKTNHIFFNIQRIKQPAATPPNDRPLFTTKGREVTGTLTCKEEEVVYGGGLSTVNVL